MLALISLFLATFLVAAIAVWLYRLMFGAQNYESGEKSAENSMSLSANQGNVYLKRKSAKPSGAVKTSRPARLHPQLRAAGSNKVPWGW